MQLMAEVLFQKRAQKQAHHCYLTQNQRTAEKPARGHCTGCTEGQSRLPGAGKTQQAWWSFAAGDYRLAGRGRIRAHLKLKPTIWNRVKTFFTSRTQLKQMLYAPGWWTHTHTHTQTTTPLGHFRWCWGNQLVLTWQLWKSWLHTDISSCCPGGGMLCMPLNHPRSIKVSEPDAWHSDRSPRPGRIWCFGLSVLAFQIFCDSPNVIKVHMVLIRWR